MIKENGGVKKEWMDDFKFWKRAPRQKWGNVRRRDGGRRFQKNSDISMHTNFLLSH